MIVANLSPDIERMIALLARLPGLGPRSARRAGLALLKRKDQLLEPLAEALTTAARTVSPCPICHIPDTQSPCQVCADPTRDEGLICVVEDAGASWAMERAGAFLGRYHILGGLLSALDGIGPDQLHLHSLLQRVTESQVREVVLALPATVDGQTTSHYVAERLHHANPALIISTLARGVPVGGDLDWLDDGTILQALKARRPA